jgi:predicted nucleic-acid-binding protein
MIAVDTNALLRWLLADVLPPEDAPQIAAIAAAVEEAAAPVFISAVVMAELVWLLRARVRLTREQIAAVVSGIVADGRLAVEHADAFAKAVEGFGTGGPGFVDHLIGQIARSAGAWTTLTFDRDAGRIETFTLLAPS